MLRVSTTLLSLFLSATSLLAQAAAQPSLTPEQILERHLKNWQTRMGEVTSYSTQCTHTMTDVTYSKETKFTGQIICMKPNLAWMSLTRVQAPITPGEKESAAPFTAYICNGKAVYEYSSEAKLVTEYPLNDGGIGDNLLLEFMSGSLTAEDVMKRFDLQHLKPNDPHYLYIELKPRLAKDKAEFSSMVLVLYNHLQKEMMYLPRTVVITGKNGQSKEEFNFLFQPTLNSPKLTAAAFEPRPTPEGWKYQKQSAPISAPRGEMPETQPGQPVIKK